MDQHLLEEYAHLIAHTGGGIQKGQDVIIRSDIEIADFALLVKEKCYDEGARYVRIVWSSIKNSRLDFKRASNEIYEKLDEWDTGEQEYLNRSLAVLIYLDCEDPDAFSGLDPEIVATKSRLRRKAIAPYRAKRENKYQWCIAGVPTLAWAKKVFPKLSDEQAVESLWKAILITSRAEDGNGIQNWESHNKQLKQKVKQLDEMRLKSLHYEAGNGTNFTVGLIPGVHFEAGSDKTMGTHYQFNPNIPSEECFTSPMKGEAEGIVYSSKPLSYNGVLIENFSVRFEKGKAVEVHAKKGEEALKHMIKVDEGACYLGEASLVPFDSPINKTGLLFFSTLYDENACCHLALGTGFTNLYPDYEKYTDEQIRGFGINYSISHVDFMIGTADLHIVGSKENGEKVEIFKDGTWAF